MKPRTHTGGRDPKPGTKEVDMKNKKTPSPEMQMEDAGTPASGNSGLGGRAEAAEGAMKQTSKTEAQRGGKR